MIHGLARKASGFVGIVCAVMLMGFAATGQADDKVIKVLMTTGDWKAQAWYQNVWMPKGGAPQLYRGQFIEKKVQEAAPGKFSFTLVPNSIAQQYFNAEYLSQFDVVVIGDIMVHLPDQFQTGVRDFVKNGGGLIYCANHKMPIGIEVKGQPFEDVLPAIWPALDAKGEFKAWVDGGKPTVALPDHPAIKGLDWAGAPNVSGACNMPARKDATVLLKLGNGTPVLTAWDFGKGRAILSAAIFANDEQSEAYGQWKDFGKYYAQVFTWLGEHSASRKLALKDESAKVTSTVDFTKPLNKFATGIFSIHGTEGIEGKALENFNALNLKGGFHRFDINPEEDQRGQFNFGSLDGGINTAHSLGLEPLPLLSPFTYGHPKWLWTENDWRSTTPKQADEIADMVAAILEHANHGKKGSPGYQTVVKYIEIANEPDINADSMSGYVNMIKAVGERVHRDFPGVKVGAFAPVRPNFLHPFLDACGSSYDWLSFHPYGWSANALFPFLQDITAYTKQKGHPVELLLTEWDFWIQGREKFDYMMQRYFEAVKYDNIPAALHYRLWQYAEPIYMFGVLWTGDGGGVAGQKGDPMHDAYDAFWIWRNFRGQRVEATAQTGVSTQLLQHVHVTGSVGDNKADAVLYYDWAYGGTGYKDLAKGVNYAKVTVDLKLVLPPSQKERTVTVSKATGEGFEIVKKDIKISAGKTEYHESVEIAPLTAIAVSVE